MAMVKTLVILSLCTACFDVLQLQDQDQSDRRSGAGNEETIATVTTGDETKGQIRAASTKTQVLAADGDSDLAGAQVAFPPGAILVDVDVSFGPGESLVSDANLETLDLATNTITKKGTAVKIEAGDLTETEQEMTLARRS